jgi:hypothetical protein
MAQMNFKDMLRDHEAHLHRLEGELALFLDPSISRDEQVTMTSYLDEAIAAERKIIDALKQHESDQ